MVDVVSAPHGLARQRQRAEAHLGRTLHFLDGTLEVCRGNGDHGGEAIVVGAELLPHPLVEHAALRLREDRVGRGPHGEPLVREDDLRVDAVAVLVEEALLRIGARLLAQLILALEIVEADAIGPVPFGDAPLDAVLVGDDARKTVAILRVHALRPQVGRLVGVAIRGHHEVLVRITRARGAGPADVARGLQAPEVGFVDLDLAHAVLLSESFQCTRVKGTLARSCGSNTASTDAPILTSCRGSPSRLPSMRMLPARGSSTSTTM